MDFVLTDHARKRILKRQIYNETANPHMVVTAYFDNEVKDL